MKGFVSFLSTIIAAVFLSCGLNSLLVALHVSPQMAPGYLGVEVGEPKVADGNANRDDSMLNIGDFWIDTRAPRSSNFAGNVVNDKSSNQIEYPMGM